ncbi:hypothetical protein B0H16DRAFT_355075 [Mycena metata]|uniref:Uncharacterized protein n=1 Tax=Mycena metata TaxID=1033252 RepID=A0AAD7JLC8_9AGAR|nr:hypothetical protein B0H16DRAFT_355075 [Mycena metata]
MRGGRGRDAHGAMEMRMGTRVGMRITRRRWIGRARDARGHRANTHSIASSTNPFAVATTSSAGTSTAAAALHAGAIDADADAEMDEEERTRKREHQAKVLAMERARAEEKERERIAADARGRRGRDEGWTCRPMPSVKGRKKGSRFHSRSGLLFHRRSPPQRVPRLLCSNHLRCRPSPLAHPRIRLLLSHPRSPTSSNNTPRSPPQWTRRTVSHRRGRPSYQGRLSLTNNNSIPRRPSRPCLRHQSQRTRMPCPSTPRIPRRAARAPKGTISRHDARLRRPRSCCPP